MNWDAIGALAELAGALGVILSLAYLAVQIRQNTRQMENSARAARGAAYQNALSNYQSHLIPIALDAELAEIFLHGINNFGQLNETDAFRFNWLMGGYMTNLDNMYYQHQDGVVSAERWLSVQSQLRWFLAYQGFVAWWTGFDKSTLSPDFVAIVDAEFKNIARD
jgi:hypothetical protein